MTVTDWIWIDPILEMAKGYKKLSDDGMRVLLTHRHQTAFMFSCPPLSHKGGGK